MTAAAHKFHGPKGAGFMFIRKDKKIQPFVHGGAQERNMRGGTENVYVSSGLRKRLEIAYRDMAEHTRKIESLKRRMIEKLRANIPVLIFTEHRRIWTEVYILCSMYACLSQRKMIWSYSILIFKGYLPLVEVRVQVVRLQVVTYSERCIRDRSEVL
jgi:cysteine sulfinate desulfinase/cysteine desulfurase-like protein